MVHCTRVSIFWSVHTKLANSGQTYNRRPREDEVDQAKPKTSHQSHVVGSSGLLEHSTRVEGDDVDTAHLLGDHDDKRGQRRATETGDGEEFDEPLNICRAVNDLPLDLELRVDVVQISCCLDRVIAKAEKRLHGVLVSVLLHEPTRRLGAEVDQNQQGNRGDESTAQL